MNDWLTSDDESAGNKRAFLLAHGSANHIRQIVDASPDVHHQTGRMDLAMHNPHCPADVFEHAFKKPYLREKVAKNANCPPHIHEQALKHPSHEVRWAALSSNLATYTHLQAAKNDPNESVRSIAHHRIEAAKVGLRPLKEHSCDASDAFQDIPAPRKTYINFSAEIGTLICHQNTAENVAKVMLEEQEIVEEVEYANKRTFLAKHGSGAHITQIIHGQQLGDVNSAYSYDAVTKNRNFTRAHLEMMRDHHDPEARYHACGTDHTTTADLHKLMLDPDESVAHHAKHHLGLRTMIQDMYDHEGRISDSHREWSQKFRDGVVTESVEKKSYTGFLESVGLKPVEEPVGENHELYSTYGWGDIKRIYVPKTNIIAGASETNEGLAAMGMVAEDVQGAHAPQEWQTGRMADHLQLSDGVHGNYGVAGVNHYPYTQPGRRTDYSRITTVHQYNYHSRPVNDFLHRNYHGQVRPWDAKMHEIVGKLDGIFKDNQTKDPLNVISGLKQSPQSIIDHARSVGHEVGDHIHLHLPAYTSTTTRPGTALAFARHFDNGKNVLTGDQHLLHVHVPAGNHLIGLETHPDLENGHESEIVMPRDTIVRVNTTPHVFRQGNRNIHVWMSHVVGSNPTPLKSLPHDQ